MFKGGDYVDNPNHYDENVNRKNTLDNSVRINYYHLFIGHKWCAS